MLALWVLGVLALVVTGLLCARVGVLVRVEDAAFTLDIRAGPLRFRFFPRRKKPRGKKWEKKQRKKPEKAEKKTPSPRRRLTLRNLRLAFRTLPPALRRLAVGIGRGVRVHPCTLRVRIGGREDPAAAARTCGLGLAAMWAVMPVLERTLSIPDPRMSVEVDFQEEATSVRGEFGVAARTGTLLLAGLSAFAVALRELLRARRAEER